MAMRPGSKSVREAKASRAIAEGPSLEVLGEISGAGSTDRRGMAEVCMDAVPQESWPEYSTAVWQAFTERSGRSERLMGAGEWWVLRGWLRAGIPLRVVLRAFQDTGGRGQSLAYYGPSVREAYERWRLCVGGTR